jgi:tetratricopeptide (TPR) repeat protein
VPHCDRAITLQPNRADGYHCRADAQLQVFEGKYLYRWDLEEKLRGDSVVRQKELEPLIADCSTAIKLASDMPEPYMVCGKARRYANDIDAALADYVKLSALQPSAADVYHNFGLTKKQKNDVPGAVAAYTKAIELHPKFIMAYIDRALARQQMGDLIG